MSRGLGLGYWVLKGEGEDVLLKDRSSVTSYTSSMPIAPL